MPHPGGSKEKMEDSLVSGETAWQPVHVSHRTGCQQGNPEETVPQRPSAMDGQRSPPTDCLGWASGVLPAAGLWEEPGA